MKIVPIADPNKEGDYAIINESDFVEGEHTLWPHAIPDIGWEGEGTTAPAPVDPDPERIDNPVFGSPKAEALAAEHGIAPDDIVGTGKNGKILIRDVEAVIS